jgi:hypothetical protein
MGGKYHGDAECVSRKVDCAVVQLSPNASEFSDEESGRGLPQSKSFANRGPSNIVPRLGLRQSSAAFHF